MILENQILSHREMRYLVLVYWYIGIYRYIANGIGILVNWYWYIGIGILVLVLVYWYLGILVEFGVQLCKKLPKKRWSGSTSDLRL